MSSKSSVKSKIAAARLPERSIEICLRGDLVAEHEQLESELQQAEQNPSTSLAGNGAGDLAERIEALETEMRESTQTFVLRALPQRRTPAVDRPTYRELVQQHPPRRGPDGEIIQADADYEFNTDEFYEALLRLSVVEPELDEEDWAALLPVLSGGQFAMLAAAAMLLNRGEISIPFSRAASRMKRTSASE